MVAVQMADEYAHFPVDPSPCLQKLFLRSFTAVEKQVVQGLCAPARSAGCGICSVRFRQFQEKLLIQAWFNAPSGVLQNDELSG